MHNIAILGAGLFAKEAHLPAIASLGDQVALVAVYSRSYASAKELADLAQKTLPNHKPIDVYHDGEPNANLDALLARPDISAVAVVLPITTQPDVIVKAFKAGKHVLSEKPVAKDVKSGIELIKIYQQQYKPKGIIWRVAENFECEPGFRAAGKAIKDGKIGRVAFFSFSTMNALDESSKWYKTPWRTVPDYQGGFLLDGGVHSAGALRTVITDPIVTLSGFASLTKKYLAPEDTIQAIVKTSTGAHGIFELSFAAPSSSRAFGATTITGSTGWIKIETVKEEIDGKSKNILRVTVNTVKEDGVDPKGDKVYKEVTEVMDEPWNGVNEEFASFFKHVDGHDDGLGGPKGALKDVALIEAALNSNGTPVDLAKLVPEF